MSGAPLRAVSLGAAIAASVGGCYTMKPVTLADLADHRVARVWVTSSKDSSVILYDAQVFRGKLVGFVEGRYRVIAPEDLAQLQVRTMATGRTVSLIAAGALGLTVSVILLSGNEPTYDPCVGGPVDCGELTP